MKKALIPSSVINSEMNLKKKLDLFLPSIFFILPN